MMGFELKVLLEHFGVDLWKQGAEDFIALTLALYLDMGFMGRGEYSLKSELDGLARRRGMPLKWLYVEMRAALLPLIEAPADRLAELGISAPAPGRRTVPAMAAALAQWLWDYCG